MIVLPYVGSKYRILPLIEEKLPENNLYVEPFSGGFSLGLGLINKGLVDRVVLNDLDEEVVNFWREVKEDAFRLSDAVDNLYKKLETLLFSGDVSLSDMDKRLIEGANSNLSRAALFYLYRKMNFGTSRRRIDPFNSTPKMDHTDKFFGASQLLDSAIITNRSYQYLGDFDGQDTLWYFDPPYVDARNANYYAVCKEEQFDHTALRDFISTLRGNFILSYDNSDLIRELYKDAHITTIRVHSALNKMGYSEELLISNMDLGIPSIETDGTEFFTRTTVQRVADPQELTLAELLVD